MNKIICLSDLDGCIINTPAADTDALKQGVESSISDANRRVLASRAITLPFITALVATDFDQFFPRIFARIDEFLQEGQEAVLTEDEKRGINNGYFSHRLNERLPTVPGAIETINNSQDPFGIVSSNPTEEIKKILRNAGVDLSRISAIVEKNSLDSKRGGKKIHRGNAKPWGVGLWQLMRERMLQLPDSVCVWEDDSHQLEDLDRALTSPSIWTGALRPFQDRGLWHIQGSAAGCTPREELDRLLEAGIVDSVVSEFSIPN